MSSQPISQLFSSILARLKRLQNKIKSGRVGAVAAGLNEGSQNAERGAAFSPAKTAKKSVATEWWARLYRGLVIDSSARHYRQMGQAVWLFLYFLLNANWKTGRLYRRLSTITADTGINLFAIRRWLRVLQRNGYVNACYNGRFWVIAVNKWKPLQSLVTRKRKRDIQYFKAVLTKNYSLPRKRDS
jgi:hypothetical protein